MVAAEERALLKQELDQHKHNLRLLLQKKAVYAIGEEPLHLLNQIAHEEQKIQYIEQRLTQLAEKPPTAPSPQPAPRPEEGKQLPLVEIVTPSGQLVRGWLIHVLRDPIWQGIGAIVAIIALLLTVGPIIYSHVIVPKIPTRVAMVTPTFTLTPTMSATPTATNTPTHTPTPTPSEEVAEVVVEFLTTKQGTTITVKPDATITAAVEEIVRVKVGLSTTYEEQEENFVFTWYTCRKGYKPKEQTFGNPEMLYVAPSEPGADCICVVIEKGGVQLDREKIFVEVQR